MATPGSERVTPSYDELLLHVRKHTEEMFTEAVFRFGGHGGDMPSDDERALLKAQGALAALLLRRYQRETAVRQQSTERDRRWLRGI